MTRSVTKKISWGGGRDLVRGGTPLTENAKWSSLNQHIWHIICLYFVGGWGWGRGGLSFSQKFVERRGGGGIFSWGWNSLPMWGRGNSTLQDMNHMRWAVPNYWTMNRLFLFLCQEKRYCNSEWKMYFFFKIIKNHKNVNFWKIVSLFVHTEVLWAQGHLLVVVSGSQEGAHCIYTQLVSIFFRTSEGWNERVSASERVSLWSKRNTKNSRLLLCVPSQNEKMFTHLLCLGSFAKLGRFGKLSKLRVKTGSQRAKGNFWHVWQFQSDQKPLFFPLHPGGRRVQFNTNVACVCKCVVHMWSRCFHWFHSQFFFSTFGSVIRYSAHFAEPFSSGAYYFGDDQ